MDLDVAGDEERAQVVIDELIARFGRWLDANRAAHPAAESFDVDHVLEWKAHRADGHLGWWTRGHVDELLTVDLPRRLSASPDQAASFPPSIVALVTFLDQEGLLDPDGEDADPLARRALALTETFLAAMSDVPTHGGPTKRIFDAMGFDPDDGELTQARVDDVLARFNSLSFEERGQILGLGDEGAPFGAPQADAPPSIPLPARPIPSPDELDRLAGPVPWVQRVDALVAELGRAEATLTVRGWPSLADGRRIVTAVGLPDTLDGRRSTADVRELVALVDVAVLAGAADEVGNRLVASDEWSHLRPGERWEAVVDAVMEAGPATLAFGRDEPDPEDLADIADQAVMPFLAMMWLTGDTLTSSDLATMIGEAVAEGLAGPEVASDRIGVAASAVVRASEALNSLVDVGVVAIDGDGEVSLASGPEKALDPWLSSFGFEVVWPEDFAAMDAGELLDAAVDGRIDPAPEMLAEWFAAVPGRAAEVVAAAVARPEPVRLLSAHSLLDSAGETGRAVLRAAIDTPLGPLTWMELIDSGEVDVADAPPAVRAEAGVLTMLALIDGGGPIDLVEQLLALPPEELPAMVDHLATASHPRTGELLEVIGRHLPHKAAKKHARKQAHRWRSRHGIGH